MYECNNIPVPRSIHAAVPASSAFFNRYALKTAECTVSSSSSPAFPKSCTRGPSLKPLVPVFASLFPESVTSVVSLSSLFLSTSEVGDIPKALLVVLEAPKPKPTGFPKLPFGFKPPKPDDVTDDGFEDGVVPNTVDFGKPKGLDLISLLSLDDIAVEDPPKGNVGRGVVVVVGSVFVPKLRAGVELLLSILNVKGFCDVNPFCGEEVGVGVGAGSGARVVGVEGSLNRDDDPGVEVENEGVKPLPRVEFPKREGALDEEDPNTEVAEGEAPLAPLPKETRGAKEDGGFGIAIGGADMVDEREVVAGGWAFCLLVSYSFCTFDLKSLYLLKSSARSEKGSSCSVCDIAAASDTFRPLRAL